MRVTEKILYQQSLTGLQENLKRIQRLQENLATGLRINRPSDDPSGAAQVIRFDTLQNQINQYVRNTDAAQIALNVTDTVLAEAVKILEGAKAVALSEASGGSTAEGRAISSLQIQNAFNQLVQIANTTFNGQYIFSGFATDTPAYDNAGVYQGDGGAVQIEIGPGATVARNLPGENVFGTASGGVDIFALLTNLKTAIDANDTATIQSLLAPLSDAVQQVAESEAEVGVRLQGIEAARQRHQSLSLAVAQIRSGREQADMAQVITEFSIQEAVLKAVQDSTARILQTSLLDFLR